MTELAQAFSAAYGVTVATQFGFSGRIRERIETSDKVNVFTPANMGHPAKLMADGRAAIMTMFARNAPRLLSPERIGPVTSEAALDAMLRDGMKSPC